MSPQAVDHCAPSRSDLGHHPKQGRETNGGSLFLTASCPTTPSPHTQAALCLGKSVRQRLFRRLFPSSVGTRRPSSSRPDHLGMLLPCFEAISSPFSFYRAETDLLFLRPGTRVNIYVRGNWVQPGVLFKLWSTETRKDQRRGRGLGRRLRARSRPDRHRDGSCSQSSPLD